MESAKHKSSECNCPNCGYIISSSKAAPLSYEIAKEKMNRKLAANEGDCDLPHDSSEDEENTFDIPVQTCQSNHPKHAFSTNLANNRWIRRHRKKAAKAKDQGPPKHKIPVKTVNLVEEMKKIRTLQKHRAGSLNCTEQSFDSRLSKLTRSEGHSNQATPPLTVESYI